MPGDDELIVQVAGKAYAAADGGRHEVLRDLAFTGRRGEILAVLGPSGTGKTTLLRIILGLDRAFEGRVTLPRGHLGVMFQEPRLLPWLSVADNLRLTAGTAAAEIPGLLAQLGLAGTETQYPRGLSLGMARRVALVRALLGRPAMLVLDEPFASLDPKAGGDMARLLVRAARRDAALVVLATHDLDQALGVADRLLMLGDRPARLVADWPNRPAAARTDSSATHDMRQNLLTRFPFLRADVAPEVAP